ncbi:hypothetical protein [Acholeplasma hippikon]|uniref:Uncharacterized protein n=1 Tax=Acholeplasma hippikon TaxID=264636 RepID=A0A449BJ05_9MOLU|nr:hypothetical protein [Acholeplasma hippikon]VEU82451.1 Uncharacterised protein [Acholeplasma hippikon]
MDNNQKVLIGQGKVSKVYLIEGAAYKCFPTSYPLSWILIKVGAKKVDHRLNQKVNIDDDMMFFEVYKIVQRTFFVLSFLTLSTKD